VTRITGPTTTVDITRERKREQSAYQRSTTCCRRKGSEWAPEAWEGGRSERDETPSSGIRKILS
jgi:hypothetical protein